jgi:hypothetical protein
LHRDTFQVGISYVSKYGKIVFLNRQKTIPTAVVPSVSRNRTESGIALSYRNNLGSDIAMQLPFRILDENTKKFPKFNATGRRLFIKFNCPGEEREPIAHLQESITSITDYLVCEVPGVDLVGHKIRKSDNVQDKVIGISLRRCDQLKTNVIWDVLGKVIQSNARFFLTDHLEGHLDNVSMPADNAKRVEKSKGR